MVAPHARPDPEKARAEAARLEGEIDKLTSEWAHLPRYALTGVLAIPAAVLWGLMGFILAVLATLSLVGTAAYLLYVRRREAEGDLAMLREDMAES